MRQYQVKVRYSTVCLQGQLQHVLDREHELARQALREGNKDRARLALRRRAYQQGLIDKTDQQLATLQELVCLFNRLTSRFLPLSLLNWSKALFMVWSRATKY